MPLVYVDIDLEEITDKQLIEEMRSRKYYVEKEPQLQNVIDWYKRGDVKEALIQLERIEPQLYGISEKVKY